MADSPFNTGFSTSTIEAFPYTRLPSYEEASFFMSSYGDNVYIYRSKYKSHAQ
jgi:hypothetical protein